MVVVLRILGTFFTVILLIHKVGVKTGLKTYIPYFCPVKSSLAFLFVSGDAGIKVLLVRQCAGEKSLQVPLPGISCQFDPVVDIAVGNSLAHAEIPPSRKKVEGAKFQGQVAHIEGSFPFVFSFGSFGVRLAGEGVILEPQVKGIRRAA